MILLCCHINWSQSFKRQIQKPFKTHQCTRVKPLRRSPSTHRPCRPLLLSQPSCWSQDPDSHKTLSLDKGGTTNLRPSERVGWTAMALVWGRTLPVCLEKVTSLSSSSASASISSSVSQPSLSPSALPGSSKSTSSKSSAKSSEHGSEGR